MYHFCTIVTPDYLPYASALLASLEATTTDVELHVLIMADEPPAPDNRMKVYGLTDLQSSLGNVAQQFVGYADGMRWSLKPVFLKYLLRQHDAVIYTDCDLHFVGDWRFLFDELKQHSILLSPHWTPELPFGQEEKFAMSFRLGLFNAGFIGATRNGERLLNWWEAVCFYQMKDAPEEGFFVDQRYLDLMPVLDEAVGIIRHKGCNLGSWNIESCQRKKTPAGELVINNHFPIIFIHFNRETVKQILNGNDGLLLPYLQKYRKALQDAGLELTGFMPGINYWTTPGMAGRLKRKLSLRSRTKRFLFRLAAKL